MSKDGLGWKDSGREGREGGACCEKRRVRFRWEGMGRGLFLMTLHHEASNVFFFSCACFGVVSVVRV